MMARIEVPFFGDLERYENVKVGDLVSVAIYDSPRGGMMVANPDWIKNPNQPGLHNSKSRTRAVSALVVDSRPARQDRPGQKHKYPHLLGVVIDKQNLTIPLACVIEVLNRD